MGWGGTGCGGGRLMGVASALVSATDQGEESDVEGLSRGNS